MEQYICQSAREGQWGNCVHTSVQLSDWVQLHVLFDICAKRYLLNSHLHVNWYSEIGSVRHSVSPDLQYSYSLVLYPSSHGSTKCTSLVPRRLQVPGYKANNVHDIPLCGVCSMLLACVISLTQFLFLLSHTLKIPMFVPEPTSQFHKLIR